MRVFFGWVTVSIFALGVSACDNTANGETVPDGAVSSAPETSLSKSTPTALAAEPQTKRKTNSTLEVGAPAPQFELPGSDGQRHKLSDYSGQHTVLAFFPKAFTGG